MSKPWFSPTLGQHQTGANDKAVRFDRGLRTYQKHIGVVREDRRASCFHTKSGNKDNWTRTILAYRVHIATLTGT
ncbi:MAG: hypothetical protein EOP48_05355 [Sphingobacteriales bacterium]|nr:MAG: hypothetical protein EOP48_05355 [Sphingobacteriales bacterium]